MFEVSEIDSKGRVPRGRLRECLRGQPEATNLSQDVKGRDTRDLKATGSAVTHYHFEGDWLYIFCTLAIPSP